MRYCGIGIGIVLVTALWAASVSDGRAADDKGVVGTWKVSFEPGDGTTHTADVAVTKDGAGLKAVYTEGTRKVTAKDVQSKDGAFRFTIDTQYEGAASSTTFEEKVTGDAWSGTCKWSLGGMTGSFPFTAKRQPAQGGK